MTDFASTRFKCDVLLSAEQDSKVVVKPPAAVVSGVHYDCITVSVFAKHTVVDLTIAVSVHASHMHVAQVVIKAIKIGLVVKYAIAFTPSFVRY